MYDYKDIVARLEKGETIQSIGDEFAAMLTKAEREHNNAERDKLDTFRSLVQETVDFFKKYYPDMDLDDVDLSDDTLKKMLQEVEAMVKFAAGASKIADKLAKEFAAMEPTEAKEVSCKAKSDPLEDFLNQFVR
jgi:hypothetical protein